MADIASLIKALKDTAVAQYDKGAPYREALASALKGDMSGVNQALSQSELTPADFAGFVGGIKGVGKVAPFEGALNLAQERAALPVSKGGLDLPANNTAMDRAKAMGFDTENVLYHGTGYDDINQFIPSKGGEYGPGVYFAENPNMANYFSSVSKGEAKNIIPTITNANQILYTSDKNILRGLGNKGLKKKGYESVVGTGLTGETQRTVLDPSQIRSINAAFDPFRRNDADILAGVGVLPFVDYTKKK